MSLTTCAVSCLMFGPDGEPEVGARFEAKLDRPEVAAGFIVPDRVIGTTDVSGVCVLNLWPNQLGATESVYIVKMTSPTGRTVTVTAVVPDSGTANLHDITTLPPYPGKSDGALVLEAAVSAGQVALAAADSATNSKAAAETAQAAAETAQAASELARDTAQSSQTAAASSQSAAATSATSAAGSATAAAGSATAAASSATAAQTAKTGAESARDAAQAAATTATGAASTASSAATTATGAASTATTKASEASVSAFAAQASESNAAASEAAAAGSAATASTKAGEAAASAAAAATFDPALFVPRSGDTTMTGPLSVPAGAAGAQVPQAQEVVGVTGSTGSAKMPSGTTAQRDGSPGVGYTRFNSTLGTNETWNGSAWVQEGLRAASLVTLSGTAVDITGIPPWAKRITLNFNGLSTNGASLKLVQLGTSAGIQTTGYRGSSVVTNGAGGSGISSIEGMVFFSNNPANIWVGSAVFTRASATANLWVGTAVVGLAGETFALFSGMDVTLPGSLDRLRLTTANGTDAFDAGFVSVSWEA